MRAAVLDTSVVVKWFRSVDEEHVTEALALRRRFHEGELGVIVPPLLALEALNVAARRWRWQEAALVNFVGVLARFGFDVREPDLDGVARWAARGLTAYDAAFVALAETESIPLITSDELVLELAPGVAQPLSSR